MEKKLLVLQYFSLKTIKLNKFKLYRIIVTFFHFKKTKVLKHKILFFIIIIYNL